VDHFKIAVLNSTTLVQVVAKLFPDASLVEIDALEDFFHKESADALITTTEAGYAMSLLHPFSNVSIFEPSHDYQILYGYPVAREKRDSKLNNLSLRIL
jgi:hypothetical protein